MVMGGIESILLKGTIDTLIMVVISLMISYLAGVPLGVWLLISKPNGIRSRTLLYQVLSRVINVLRSLPFIILLTLLIPFTRFIVGTSIGIVGMIVPLSIAAIPFVARMVEQSLSEVDPELISSMQVIGASTYQIICKVYLPEALPSLIRGVGITAIALIGYSAMAGATGGGGLGDIAIRFGYYNYRMDIMIYTVIILIVLVELIQGFTNYVSKKTNHI
jgi:D-methionine transport system permease protein